ncbi:MAG TPA: UvrD-helicase domain-containing protein [Nitriliruptoraceae bacterium]|nr:UvrD-helicase domain-containing protein [Nitriliruptoraceae bacterium]
MSLPSDLSAFDITAPLPRGRVSLQASAGTGKTWTIAALVTRTVAEGEATLDELLVVTFTRAATAELRHRIRERLTEALHSLRATLDPDGGPPAAQAPPVSDAVLAIVADPNLPHGERVQRVRRLQDALATIDHALISTIHGFAHQVLRSAGHIGDIDGQRTLVEDVDDLVVATGRDLVVRRYADEQDDEVLAAMPSQRTMTALTVQRLRHPHARIAPDPDDPSATSELEAIELARMADLVTVEIDDRKLRRGVMTFDDLLHQLAAALRDERVRDLVLATFRQRFRIALVDEAQDTDPVQWEIIEALFADRTLVIIGDPKQAIYRFRGADVEAYVAAVEDPATQQASLATNHRSDRDLVAAVNLLFRDTTFGHPAIQHLPVDAAHATRLHDPADHSAVHLHVTTKNGGTLYAAPTRELIARDVASRIATLLASEATIDDEDDGPRRVKPGDLAILVRAHASVDFLTRALGDVGIPFVVTSVGSVFDTPAASHWRTLLAVLQRPSSTHLLRAVAGSPFVGWDADQMAAGDRADLDDLAAMAHRWRRILDADGVASLLRTIHDDTALGPRLLGREGGQRLLTDIEHIAELLHRSEAATHGPSAMAEWLVQQTQRVTADDIPAEERSRRLESDSAAVTIMTVHASKGLEFPIVYLPYMMWSLKAPSIPFTTTGRDPVLELGGPDQDVHKADGKVADAGENLRLAYVAMTRARHRVEAWWWEAGGYTSVPLSKLLVRRTTEPSVSAAGASGRVAGLHAALDDLVARGDGAIAWSPIPEDPPAPEWEANPDTVAEVSAAVFDRGIDRTWTRASYTMLTTPLDRVQSAEIGVDTAGITARTDDDHDTSPGSADRGPDRGPGEVPLPLPLPLGAMTGGARIGTIVHDLYEHVDFAAPDVSVQLAQRLAHLVGADVESTMGMPTDRVVDGVAATLDTPLGSDFGDLRLRDVAPPDRLDEMAFELPVAAGGGRGLAAGNGNGHDGGGREKAGSGSTPIGHHSPLRLAAIREVFGMLPSDDPFAGYTAHLDDPALARTIRGYLTGFVDLVLRRRVDDHDVFHVVDYKTNVLYRRDQEPTTAHYDHDALVAAMLHGHYPLQAALYAVALHRYLRWRVADYDPQRHLGSIGYLFVRGMVGPSTPVVAGRVTGVMAWHPPASFVAALSDCLHAGEVPR